MSPASGVKISIPAEPEWSKIRRLAKPAIVVKNPPLTFMFDLPSIKKMNERAAEYKAREALRRGSKKVVIVREVTCPECGEYYPGHATGGADICTCPRKE